MEQVKDFFKLLKKYVLVLILVPIVTVLVVYYPLKNLPKQYVSQGLIATGFTDQSRAILDPLGGGLQETRLMAQFGNLKSQMMLKRIWDALSYKLIIHDLSTDAPFRSIKGIKEYKAMDNKDKLRAIALFSRKLERMEPMNATSTYEDWLNGLLIAMKYDEGALKKALMVDRMDASDLVSATATTESSELSAFMVNTYVKIFIDYYTSQSTQSQTNNVEFLADLLKQKKEEVDSARQKLQSYKIANDILNLEEQSKSIQTQKQTAEDMLVLLKRQVSSLGGAIKNIKSNLSPSVRAYAEAESSRLNATLVTSRERLNQLVALKYRDLLAPPNPGLERSIDSLQKRIIAQGAAITDAAAVSPLTGKEAQLQQLRTLQVEYDQAFYSQSVIQSELTNLDSRFKKLVPLDAKVQTYTFEIENATKEYEDVFTKYNQAIMQASANSKLTQIVMAVPEGPQPSKWKLFVIGAGLGTFVICLVVMFVLWYMDDSINSPVRLANITNLPVLGALNKLPGNNIDLRKLWDGDQREKMKRFKDLLRSVRFEIDQELAGKKILAVTSMRPGEGKTLLSISLAYSYAMINKKVLLIDGNYEDPTITRSVMPEYYVEDVLKNTTDSPRLTAQTNVLGNYGGDVTLLEVSDEKAIKDKFAELQRTYDIIIIETPALSALSKAKEWFIFADKIVSVFEAGQSIFNGKKLVVKYFQNEGDKFSGWILNKQTMVAAPKKGK
ncbi:exopolysaccharide transport family protein [Mucilaginibacter myungsuensis]|uniref:AAA family ATPase n=1 Tax=Mucilaginibacter myungsuensis TaxID=649104 RepID=A0A929KY51_9SPHI|nr:AAA family ATPase [Mucilaginibacter myungsuensis]MBE9662063.1 AAA family ATPase [Mucilaginibacter myungsuensis]MDN3599504.1 AAA family ATPase [Mucilaginibacter myungsuensis]